MLKKWLAIVVVFYAAVGGSAYIGYELGRKSAAPIVEEALKIGFEEGYKAGFIGALQSSINIENKQWTQPR